MAKLEKDDGMMAVKIGCTLAMILYLNIYACTCTYPLFTYEYVRMMPTLGTPTKMTKTSGYLSWLNHTHIHAYIHTIVPDKEVSIS